MNPLTKLDTAITEHRFWLQIMGDHSRFIFHSFSPTESEFILTAQEFIIIFDQLLEQAHNVTTDSEMGDLQLKAYEATYRLREFKIELLKMSLVSDLKSHLSASFINDMLNELEEYLHIMSLMMNDQLILFHPLHYHMLWLMDAVGHAATITSELDFIEKDMIDRAYRFEIQFQDLDLKSLIMNGYQRTNLENYPALERLNTQVNIIILSFIEFLDNIRDQRLDGKLLGTLMPLMADHMSREECYYLWKLSQTTKNVRYPDCDPGRPRMEA